LPWPGAVLHLRRVACRRRRTAGVSHAAAARESRAFPAFAYDATGGDNWATRYSLDHNRNPDADWPHDQVEYADAELQRVVEEVAFTYVDFALCDRRYAAHFSAVPRERWSAGMLPVSEWLRLPEKSAGDRVPYVWAVDADDRLWRVIVDTRLMQSGAPLPAAVAPAAGARGHSRFARRASAGEGTRHVEGREGAGASGPGTCRARRSRPTRRRCGAGRDGRRGGSAAVRRPWIETARCPSCNECQNINDKMFAYNENKQAFIKDLNAGTYRQMVEAAESCQVAIIHPGKPWNRRKPVSRN
jgi:ferredoxin